MAAQTKDKVEEMFCGLLLTSSSAIQVREKVKFLEKANFLLTGNSSAFFNNMATALRQNVEKGYAPQQQDATVEQKTGPSFSKNNNGG